VRVLCADPLAVDDAIAGLQQRSLIGSPTETFNVHRLVQAVTRDQLSAEEQAGWKAIAAALVEAAVPGDTSRRESSEVCRLLLPHAQVAADPLSMAMWRLAKFLGDSGDYAATRAEWHVLTNAYEAQLGPNTPTSWPPGLTWPLGLGRPGMRRRPATCWWRCCRSGRRSPVPNTPTL